jgi:hypothetical protein
MSSTILGIFASGGGAAVPTNFIAVGFTASPNIHVYSWLPGFGTKYANPSTLPADSGRSVTWNAAKDTIAVSFDNTPYVAVYPWTNAGGFGTKYSDPATTPTGNAGGVAFSSNGSNIAVAHNTSPRVTAYPWSGSGFGTKYANPATLPPDDGKAVAFNSSGNALSVGSAGSGGTSRINVYAWSSGFSTRYAPSVIERTVQGTAFSPAGTTIGFATTAPPYVDIYPWNNPGFGTKYSNPGSSLPDEGYGIGFSADSTAVAIAHNLSPYISAYPWSPGFGTKYADPSTAVTANARSVAFI